MRPKPPKSLFTPNPANLCLDAAAVMDVPRPISTLARTDNAGHSVAPHSHVRDQLVYAIKGVMRVEAQDSIWTIPSNFGLWIPAHVEHAVKMVTHVEIRTLYFSSGYVPLPAQACRVMTVSPLLRELIIRATLIPPLYEENSADGRIMRVIADELGQESAISLSLKLPKDRRLGQLCAHILHSLETTESIAQLGAQVGLSERSISRLFPLETGLTVNQWRQQAKLMQAFALAEQSESLTTIASKLGYSHPAAFSKMFRRILGKSPREFLFQK